MSALPVNILRLSPSRWYEFRDLRLAATQELPHAFLSTPEELMKISPEEWQHQVQNMVFAQVGAELAGMIGCYQDDKERLRHTLHVISFYVLPKFRGQGLGKKLLQAVLEIADNNPEIKKLQLEVEAHQSIAQAMYCSVGFEQVGVMKGHIKLDDKVYDTVLMEKYL